MTKIDKLDKPDKIDMEKEIIVITLPIPSSKLAANSRCHWAVKAKETKAHRKIAHVYTSHQMKFSKPRIKGYKLVFYWPDNRRRDKRNAAERCKAYEDGIADWLCQDDSEWDFNGVQFAPVDKKKPRVEFHLEPEE